jgi:hypothetical protein
MNPVLCKYCNQPQPGSAERCPHCGRPGLFPNVDAASENKEREALRNRYTTAVAEARLRGAGERLEEFERIAATAHAVISRSSGEVLRLAESDSELYGTFYQWRESGLRIPKGDKWNIVRVLTDHALFPGYKENIRFATLSLTSQGLVNYGECTLVLKDAMIAHRGSVFEENSVLWMERHEIKVTDAHELPPGYRAVWEDRGRLAAAKLGQRIAADTKPGEFPDLLLRNGVDSGTDDFIEVHVFGPMTIRSFERIWVDGKKAGVSRAKWKALREKLRDFGVTVEVAR